LGKARGEEESLDCKACKRAFLPRKEDKTTREVVRDFKKTKNIRAYQTLSAILDRFSVDRSTMEMLWDSTEKPLYGIKKSHLNLAPRD
jgi:hypothetical protein